MAPVTPTPVGSPDTRTIRLPGGQRLIVRPVRATDAADLAELYATLSRDDLRRRCAAMARSGPGAVDRMATVGDRERVIASTDCGFGTFTKREWVIEPVVWLKLKAIRQGADIASQRLWGKKVA